MMKVFKSRGLLGSAFMLSCVTVVSRADETIGPEKGTLVIVGGGDKEHLVFNHFVELAGGKDAKLVVVPTASSSSPEYDYAANKSAKYAREELEMPNVSILHTHDPAEADTAAFVQPIREADAIWFSGGRQWRIADSYLGTLAEREFRKVLERDGVIGGSSAGASIQGSFLVRGDTSGSEILIGDHQHGLAYIKNSAIDQHVIPRNRQRGLIKVLTDPDHKMRSAIDREALLGIGIDEATGIVVRGNEFEVVGKKGGVVLIYDPATWKQSAADRDKYQTLFNGAKYNLKDRVVIDIGTPTQSAMSFDKLSEEVQQLVDDGAIVGSQIAVRRGDKLLFSECFGAVAVDSERRVDQDTLFLIGSCSKPFASACILGLISEDDVAIELNSEIDRWLPAFGIAKVVGSDSVNRAPTVSELMGHRAGIYSQKEGMTQAQAHWIRSYQLSLEESVEGIESCQLIAQPGKRYAYSGAGYCVLGRVAELASGKSIEFVLQDQICEPLGLTRTTYFPSGKFRDEEIATGMASERAPHRLGKDHRMPLVGGSLYTTANETTRFAGAIAARWHGTGELNIKSKLVEELGRPLSPESEYGLGWKVTTRENLAPRLSHSGALQAYRAWLAVDLGTRVSVAGCWTLATADRQPEMVSKLNGVFDGP